MNESKEDLQRQAQEKVGAEILSQMTRKLNLARARQARRLLLKGEDPFIIAAWLRVPFKPIAVLANRILKEKGATEQIPTDLREYLQLAEKRISAQGK